MDAGVVGKLWVEGGDEHVLLAGGDGFAFDSGKDFDVGASLLNIRSTDESHGYLADALELALCVEAPQLPAVGIPTGEDVHCAEVVPVEHDEAGTGTQDRQAAEDGLTDRLEQFFIFHNPYHGSAFAARDDKSLRQLKIES